MSTTIRDKYFQILKIDSKYINQEAVTTLFCETLNMDKNQLFLNMDNRLIVEDEIDSAIARLVAGEPLQYIMNKAWFLNSILYVDNNVLIPRQETEQLVLESASLINSIFKKESINILDVGSGSGNIAIEIKKRFPKNEVKTLDLSQKALDIAKNNAKNNGVEISFINLDIFTVDSLKNYQVIISNPPYIKDPSTVEYSTLNYEPKEALFAEPSTRFYEHIIKLVSYEFNREKLLCFEIGENMKDRLIEIIQQYLPNSMYFFNKDIYGKDRFLYIMKDMNKNISHIIDTLNNHEVVAFPTDTVMGFAIRYDDREAFEKLNKIKGRPEGKPYSLMVAFPKDIEKYAYVDENSQRLIDTLLPGPLTLLLKAKNVPFQVDYGSGVIGVRVAPTEDIKKIIEGCGYPLLVPSANKSGEKPCFSSIEARIKFPDITVLDGQAKSGKATTIVDLTQKEIKIIREGDISLTTIKKILKGE